LFVLLKSSIFGKSEKILRGKMNTSVESPEIFFMSPFIHPNGHQPDEGKCHGCGQALTPHLEHDPMLGNYQEGTECRPCHILWLEARAKATNSHPVL
jgi:hypothetical protein